jgi:hypothetical protein
MPNPGQLRRKALQADQNLPQVNLVAVVSEGRFAREARKKP